MTTEIYKVDQKYFKDKEDAFREALKKNFAVITLNLIESSKEFLGKKLEEIEIN